jgi:hypothetical protein
VSKKKDKRRRKLEENQHQLTNQIRHIPNQPHGQKRQTNPLRTLRRIIQNQLRNLFFNQHFHSASLSPSSSYFPPSKDIPFPPILPDGHHETSADPKLTSRKIHVAKLTLPKTPLSASCTLSVFPRLARTSSTVVIAIVAVR